MDSTSPRPTTLPPPPWHALPPDEALARLGSSEQGLAPEAARERLQRLGPNVLAAAHGPRWPKLLARQVHNPIVYLLLASAALALLLGTWLDGRVVLGAVVLNAAIGFLQELRAGRAIEALSRMVPQLATVVRGGQTLGVPAAELVPGDVVLLASGDRVPADLRLLDARSLRIEEAALTGESVPAEKTPAALAPDMPVADRRSMAFGGTLVTSGTARAVVVATGSATELGRISRMLGEATELQTPLTRALDTEGKGLTLAVLALALALLGVGLARGYSLADALLVGVTLAVATIPEGLPAIITIALAIGVQRMAARRAVIRTLPSVETLGSTTVICTDKTGTLTRNEMTVQALWTPALGGAGAPYGLSGVGYAPEGALERAGLQLPEPPEDLRRLLEAAALCSDATLRCEAGRWEMNGDPTEGALVSAAEKLGVQVEALRAAWPRVDALPFESEQQFMATLHAAPGGARRLLLKGAPEVVLGRCALPPGLDAGQVLRQVERLARGGMRVLAVAEAPQPPDPAHGALQPGHVASGLTLLGLQGMIDPPREEALVAVRACHAAGIRVKMITGDHPGTAEAIGERLGLSGPGARTLTGAQLSRLDPPA
ncbi:MAG TPA: HAD-IC family P-type ATPase, partial [Aggregicoccus sp.]|nr:HAD-IC family P-type ATPase [Aggregicoccus sp.]